MGLRIKAAVGLLAIVAGLLGSVPASAGHNDDDHSKNVKMLARKPIVVNKDLHAQGSDLAFKGRRMYAGTYQGTALYKIVGARKGHVKQIGFHDCPGNQGDVSIVGVFAFVSIDSPGSNNGRSAVCNNTKTTGFHKSESLRGQGRDTRRQLPGSEPAEAGGVRGDEVWITHPHPRPRRRKDVHVHRVLPAQPGGRLQMPSRATVRSAS